MSIEALVEKFIREDLLMGSGPDKIDPDTSLLESGLIDSLTLLRLITFIEEEFGVKIEDDEVMPEYFDTLTAIRELVERKK